MGRKVLGIEISSIEIKLALVNNGRHPTVLYCEIIPAPDLAGAALNDDDNEIMSVALAVKEAISKEEKLMRGTDSISLCLSDQQTVVRHMTLPALKKKELLAAVEYELSQSFPRVGKTHSISFKQYLKSKKQITGIVSFSPRKTLEAYGKLLEQLNFKRSYIDVLANSQAKAVHMLLNTPITETVLVCDIGTDFSHFTVIKGNQVMQSRQVSYGYSRATETVKTKLGINSYKFGAFFISESDLSNISKTELNDIISTAYSGVEEQLRQTIEFYSMDTRDTPITHVLLTGTGSVFPDLDKHLSINIGIPVSTVHPPGGINTDIRTFAGSLAAIGAAIRED